MFGRSKSQVIQQKKPKVSNITYKLSPSNYAILSEQEKSETLRKFVNMITATEKKLTLSILTMRTGVAAGGSTHEFMDKSVFVSSKYDMGQHIAGANFGYTRLETPIEFPIKYENSNSMMMESGAWWKAYSVYNFPRTIAPVWILTLSDICSVVNVELIPVTQSKARNMLVGHANTLEARIGNRYRTEAAEAKQINDLIVNQETTLFEVGVTAVVTADDKKSLNKNAKLFESKAKQRSISCMSVSGKQADTLHGWDRRFLFTRESCAAFYPFMSSNMMDVDGVYIGTNELTSAPIMFDYTKRVNYNMTILGESGYGKSMTTKTYITNFLSMINSRFGKEHRIMMHVLDLHGEYVDLAEYLKMDVVDLTERTEMGLDPFSVMAKKDQAAALLAEATEMPENLKSILVSLSDDVNSCEEMVDKLKSDSGHHEKERKLAATYLAQFAQGGIARMFRGEKKIGDRTIISMRNVDKTKENAMLISLALQKLWRDIRNTPRYVPKLLVIEEAWFLLMMDSTATILDSIARSGRKENVHMIVLTQNPDEVLNNSHGMAIINNSSTKLLLHQDANSADMLQKMLKLSNSEKEEMTSLDRGQAILRSDTNRVKIMVRPTPQQLKMFGTEAPGMTAGRSDK